MGKTVRAVPKENEIYKHFKGSLYQIVTIAVHTETSDKLVVYRSIENPERVFARPLDMFMSEVDRIRHPFVKAKYRFTLMVEAEDVEEDEEAEEVVESKDDTVSAEVEESVVKDEAKEEGQEIAVESEEALVEPELEESEDRDDIEDDEVTAEGDEVEDSDDTAIYKADGELVLDPLVEAVLDEKEFSDKIANFEKLRNKCTPDMLTAIAISLDIQLSSDSVEENYAQILKTLKMHNKYESSRLRN